MDISKFSKKVAESDNLNKSQSTLPRAGVAFLRLRDYIETGKHQPKNAAHKPSGKAHLVFELSHPDHTFDVDGVKKHGEIKVTLPMGTTAKSGFRKLFAVMNSAAGGGYDHFMELIGKPFLGEIFHSECGKYANIDKDQAWSIKEPMQVDAVANTKTPINIPEMQGTSKIFLYNLANKQDVNGEYEITDADVKEMWDSIYREGTFKKDNVEKSLNWDQEEIMESLGWEGSRIQRVVGEEPVMLEEHATPEPTTTEPNLASAAVAGEQPLEI